MSVKATKYPYKKNGPKTGQEFFKAKNSGTGKHEKTIGLTLGDKVGKNTEIELCMFTLCGLHCRFCWQDHYDETGVTDDDIRAKAKSIISYIEAHPNLGETVSIHYIGGEIFEDGTDRYQAYYDLVKEVNDWYYNFTGKSSSTASLCHVFVSNLNFNKDTREKVDKLFENFLEEGNISFTLATSYDTTGRPIGNNTHTNFYSNLEHFSSLVCVVTTVLTKSTINRLLREGNSFFDYLYEKFPVDFDYYHPSDDKGDQMPSDLELLNCLRLFLVKYPKMQRIHNWTHNDFNVITCASLNKVTILPDGTMTTCKHLEYDEKIFKTPIEYNSNASMIHSFMSTNGCLSCEFFSKCTLSCFLTHDSHQWGGKKVLSECMYKIMFREIKDGKHS